MLNKIALLMIFSSVASANVSECINSLPYSVSRAEAENLCENASYGDSGSSSIIDCGNKLVGMNFYQTLELEDVTFSCAYNKERLDKFLPCMEKLTTYNFYTTIDFDYAHRFCRDDVNQRFFDCIGDLTAITYYYSISDLSALKACKENSSKPFRSCVKDVANNPHLKGKVTPEDAVKACIRTRY